MSHAYHCRAARQYSTNAYKLTFQDFEDETVVERILALREMFPERVRDLTSSIVDKTLNATKRFYTFSREGT